MTDGWLARGTDFVRGAAENADHAQVGLVHGSMRLMLYAPRGEDTQRPHKRDEIYMVRTGRSEFERAGEQISLGQGDAVFVPALMDHRFVDFTPDFTAWVVFWGPEGGEPGG